MLNRLFVVFLNVLAVLAVSCGQGDPGISSQDSKSMAAPVTGGNCWGTNPNIGCNLEGAKADKVNTLKVYTCEKVKPLLGKARWEWTLYRTLKRNIQKDKYLADFYCNANWP